MNQKIATGIGSAIIIIMAVTAGTFVWLSEKNIPDVPQNVAGIPVRQQSPESGQARIQKTVSNSADSQKFTASLMDRFAKSGYKLAAIDVTPMSLGGASASVIGIKIDSIELAIYDRGHAQLGNVTEFEDEIRRLNSNVFEDNFLVSKDLGNGIMLSYTRQGFGAQTVAREYFYQFPDGGMLKAKLSYDMELLRTEDEGGGEIIGSNKNFEAIHNLLIGK